MVSFVWKMYLVQIKETKKIIIAMKLVIMLLCALLIQGEQEVSYYYIMTGGFMQLSLRQIGYSKLFYMLPQRAEVQKRFLYWSCRIRTGIDVILVLLTSILISIFKNAEWNQEVFIRLFLTLSLMHICLYAANIPTRFLKNRGISAAWCIIGAVIISFSSLVGYHFCPGFRLFWIVMEIVSLVLTENFMKICRENIQFGDYDEDRWILVGRWENGNGRAFN